jgi:hypothetical protein
MHKMKWSSLDETVAVEAQVPADLDMIELAAACVRLVNNAPDAMSLSRNAEGLRNEDDTLSGRSTRRASDVDTDDGAELARQCLDDGVCVDATAHGVGANSADLPSTLADHLPVRSSKSAFAPTLDETECEVVARMACVDWRIVEGMVGPARSLKESALVKIILPNQYKALVFSQSRRGGRRGTRARSRRVEQLCAAPSEVQC